VCKVRARVCVCVARGKKKMFMLNLLLKQCNKGGCIDKIVPRRAREWQRHRRGAQGLLLLTISTSFCDGETNHSDVGCFLYLCWRGATSRVVVRVRCCSTCVGEEQRQGNVSNVMAATNRPSGI
jgi:hypothetical protein